MGSNGQDSLVPKCVVSEVSCTQKLRLQLYSACDGIIKLFTLNHYDRLSIENLRKLPDLNAPEFGKFGM